MTFTIEFRPSAMKDLSGLSPDVARRVVEKVDLLKEDLGGDVKRLKQSVPRYRLRVGDWRVLFEVTGNRVEIWRVRHRREVYDR